MFPVLLVLITRLFLLGQENNHQVYHFRFNDSPLNQVLFQLIERGVPILYEGQPPQIRINASCVSCTAEQAITAVLEKTTASWSQSGNHWLIRFDPVGTGRVTGKTQAPEEVTAVRLVLNGSAQKFEALSDNQGHFDFGPIPTGAYRLFLQDGLYELADSQAITVKEGRRIELNPVIKFKSFSQHLVVTPGRYSLLGEPGAKGQYLDREHLAHTPHLSDDVMRTLATLPGANPDGLSARPRPRGSLEHEVRITLDGMRLIDPFHARELTGAVSTLDVDVIAGLELTSGGFTAEHGGALGGLLQFTSRTPEKNRTSMGIGFNTIRFLREGTFSEERGQFLLMLRSGHLDPFLGLIAIQNEDVNLDELVSPAYFDGFFKMKYSFEHSHSLSIHLFESGDEVDYDRVVDDAPGINHGDYRNTHAWINWNAFWRNDLESVTRVSLALGDTHRQTSQRDVGLTLDFSNHQDLSNIGLSQDWILTRSDYLLKMGWSIQKQTAQYDYSHFSFTPFALFGTLEQSEDFDLDLSGSAYGAYLAWRIQMNERVAIEMGMRFDDQDWIPKSQLSPRLNLAWRATPSTDVNMAWGRYHQARELYELRVEEGLDQFQKAPLAEHRLIGITHRVGNLLEARAELFWNEMLRTELRFENIWSGNFFLPQLALDRIEVHPDGGGVYGLELSVKNLLSKRFNWLANYAWNRAWDEVDHVKRPRRREQKHTLNANIGYKINERWRLSLAWHYHSGWRTTDISLIEKETGLEFEIGPIHGQQLPGYSRMDLRLSRGPGDWGISWYLDVVNLLNRQNPRGFDAIFINEDGLLQFEEETGLPFLFSFGVTWQK